MESLELGHGDEDDDSLLAALDLDLLGAGDLEGSELGLELRDVGLKVNESLSDNGLDLGGGAGGGVSRAEDLLLDGSHDDDMRTESVSRVKKEAGNESAVLALMLAVCVNRKHIVIAVQSIVIGVGDVVDAVTESWHSVFQQMIPHPGAELFTRVYIDCAVPTHDNALLTVPTVDLRS